MRVNLIEAATDTMDVLKTMMADEDFLALFDRVVSAIHLTLYHRRKIFICGCGGSASQASHFAAELMGWYGDRHRGPKACIALTTDTSLLTAISNDDDFDAVFARQIEALGSDFDLLICLSTSGDSEVVVRAQKAAQASGLQVISLTGERVGRLSGDVVLRVPASSTPRIQEIHMILLHAIAASVAP